MEHSRGTITAAVAARCSRARAEFAEWDAVLAFRDRQYQVVDEATDMPAILKRVEKSAAVTELAAELHLSEASVVRLIATADRIREKLPTVWEAFRDGRIDAQRVRLISDAVDKLEEPDSITKLEAFVVDYAAARTPAELKNRLKRFIARVEAKKAIERAEAARANREVVFAHGDEGMSTLFADIPTPIAKAIEQRLNRTVKGLPETNPDTGESDERTLPQKRADVVAHWLTASEGTDTEVQAQIAIHIDAQSLAGLVDTPGETPDGEPVPAPWVRELANRDDSRWTRVLTTPTGQVLDIVESAYRPSRKLRNAIELRDRTCRVKGCQKPATACDLDHVKPFDAGGTTTGSNLQALCRKHHAQKSHELLPPDYLRDGL